jgi:hypothetical protein
VPVGHQIGDCLGRHRPVDLDHPDAERGRRPHGVDGDEPVALHAVARRLSAASRAASARVHSEHGHDACGVPQPGVVHWTHSPAAFGRWSVISRSMTSHRVASSSTKDVHALVTPRTLDRNGQLS